MLFGSQRKCQYLPEYESAVICMYYIVEGREEKIAARLHKDPSTISREVRKYAVEIAAGRPGHSFNACKNRMSCKIKAPSLFGTECNRQGSCGTFCRLCRCNEHCPDFVEEICDIRAHVPFTNKQLALQTGILVFNSATHKIISNAANRERWLHYLGY